MLNEEYIRKNSNELKESLRQKSIFNGRINIEYKDKFPLTIDSAIVWNRLEEIPEKLIKNISTIKIGDFAELKKREIDSLYDNGVIYITNRQVNVNDVIEDVIHEIGHAIEEQYTNFLYKDDKIKEEYEMKFNKLSSILDEHGFSVDSYKKSKRYTVDDLFYKVIGYEKLSSFTQGLFISPYSATTLREYFATGFETYVLEEDNSYLEKISPNLYQKLVEIYQNE
ncbi:hypothetical protein M0R19_03090 [Candidatus Pacearchaeota archaeon]|nr:hypothetical protein [Candidatus Pacearchaeota archaeon]